MEELQILNVEIREIRQQLRVIVESIYGIDNLGLSINKKYLDIDTDKPQWLKETKYLLELKYNKSVNIETLENFSKNNTLIQDID